jgi:hypothetical protein
MKNPSVKSEKEILQILLPLQDPVFWKENAE